VVPATGTVRHRLDVDPEIGEEYLRGPCSARLVTIVA